MKRTTYYIGLGVIFVIILGATILLFPARSPTSTRLENFKKKDTDQSASPPPSTSTTTPSDKTTESKTPGRYITYTEQSFTEAAKQERILFFHAPWCPQCRQLDTDIKKQQLPDNTVILKVDYDTNQTLRQKYGVTLQTTLVRVDAKGDKLKSIVAYNNPTYAAIKPELGL